MGRKSNCLGPVALRKTLCSLVNCFRWVPTMWLSVLNTSWQAALLRQSRTFTCLFLCKWPSVPLLGSVIITRPLLMQSIAFANLKQRSTLLLSRSTLEVLRAKKYIRPFGLKVRLRLARLACLILTISRPSEPQQSCFTWSGH